MNIRIEITDTNKPYAVIYTNKITPEVQQAVSLLDTKSELITANDDEKIIIIQPTEIYMIRIENSETIIYCENHKYRSKKRLYELLSLLGKDFMQISKSAVINLKQIDFVEPSFSGMMKLFLKTNKANISQENICLNLRNILVYERSFIYEKIFRKNFFRNCLGLYYKLPCYAYNIIFRRQNLFYCE